MADKLIKMHYNSIGKRCRRPHLKQQQWEWRGGNEFEKYLEGRFKRTSYPNGCGNEEEKRVEDNPQVSRWMTAYNLVIL